jgi:hypothetical protein
MAEVWQRADLRHEWRLWIATQPKVLDDKTLRLFACWCTRQIWHLITDERSQNAVEVAELYAIGKATNDELTAALAAAGAAMDDLRHAGWHASWCNAVANERSAAAVVAARATSLNATRIAAARAAEGAARAAALEAAHDAGWHAAAATGWNESLTASYGAGHFAAQTAQAVWLIENAAPNFEIA